MLVPLAIRRGALVATCATLLVVVMAQPASAHSVGGVQPSNYRTQISTVTPRIAGIDVEVIDLGSRLQLRNPTDHKVVVLGYDDEPYLRVDRRGAFENLRSPATYLNRKPSAGTAVPESADSSARPKWIRIGAGPTIRWHDHRTHWMGRVDPLIVQQDPRHEHLVQSWRVPIRVDQRTMVIRGDVRWIPGPSPWLWILLVLVCAAATFLVANSGRAKAGLAMLLMLLTVALTTHVVGQWAAVTANVISKLDSSALSIGAAIVAVIAAGWILRSGIEAAIPAILFAGTLAFLPVGLADLDVLWRSQLVTVLPDTLARADVVLALGIGLGCVAVGIDDLRTSHRRWSDTAALLPEPNRGRSDVQTRVR